MSYRYEATIDVSMQLNNVDCEIYELKTCHNLT